MENGVPSKRPLRIHCRLGREIIAAPELKERLIIHTAHEFKTSEKHFERLEATIRNSPKLLARVKRAETNSERIIGFRY